jgi:RNA polymerase sigma-70 factor (ECF subfamily)
VESASISEPPVWSREEDLVVRHRYGDPEAFAEVYARFSELVFNLSWRLSGDREEAADLTQEVFVRVYRHLGRFQGRSSLETWIYRVTVNHCRSRLGRRSWGWWRGRAAEERVQETADWRRNPEEKALAAAEERRLVGALRRLPSPFREVVVLRDVEELSYQEIAEVLGVRLGTVRSRLARGRQRLRAMLEEAP